MTRTDALPLARHIAAGICAAHGCAESFCQYMRDGSYDDHREVLVAQAALVVGFRKGKSVSEELAA